MINDPISAARPSALTPSLTPTSLRPPESAPTSQRPDGFERSQAQPAAKRTLKTVLVSAGVAAASGAGIGAFGGPVGALVGGAIGAAVGLVTGTVLSTPVSVFSGKTPPIPTVEPGSDIQLEPHAQGGLSSPLLRPDFQKHLDEVTGSVPVSGNSVQILKNGAASFPLRYELMENAKKSINLQTLIFHSDDAGWRTANTLIQKAHEGLHCRVIFDALSSFDTDSKMFQAMRDAGVEVQAFNPVGDLQWHGAHAEKDLSFVEDQWKQFAQQADQGDVTDFLPWLQATAKKNEQHWDQDSRETWDRLKSNPPRLQNLNFRWHQKILTVDDDKAIVGGLNIGSEYANGGTDQVDDSHTAASKEKLRDTDALVTGPVLQQILHSFDKNWKLVSGEDSPPSTASGAIDPSLDAHFAGPDGDQDVSARFIAHLPHEEHDRNIENWLVEHLEHCTDTAYIPNAYFIPNKRTVDALIDAKKRGVDVRVLTNSDATKDTPVPILTPASRAHYRQLLEGGVRLYERVPGENVHHMHTKAAVFDSVACEIGSNNMDNRSRELNSEDVLAFNSVKLGTRMNTIFGDDLRDSREITLATLQDDTVLDRAEQFFYGRVLDYFL